MKFEFGHIALTVSDLEISSKFYKNCFGFEIGDEFFKNEDGLTIRMMESCSTVLELFYFENSNSLPQYRQSLSDDLHTVGTKHFALNVVDIQSVFEELKNKNVSFETELSEFFNGKKYFYLKDPDGILVEVMEK